MTDTKIVIRASCKFHLFSLPVFFLERANTTRRSEPDATAGPAARVPKYRAHRLQLKYTQDKVDPDRSPMLSLVGISGAALVMMSCLPPLAVPLQPAMGKGLLRDSKEHGSIVLQPQAGDSASAASQGWLPLGNGGQKQEVLASSPWDTANGRCTRAARVRL